MTESQLMVKEFHEFFNVPVADKPGLISRERLKLRANLILEEALESINAMGMTCFENRIQDRGDEASAVSIADGLADLIYVINGAALELGIDLEPVLKEVHRSNMSKAWSKEDVELNNSFVKESPERKACRFVAKKCGSYIGYREDGKILKSPSYSPANIEQVLKEQGYTNE